MVRILLHGGESNFIVESRSESKGVMAMVGHRGCCQAMAQAGAKVASRVGSLVYGRAWNIERKQWAVSRAVLIVWAGSGTIKLGGGIQSRIASLCGECGPSSGSNSGIQIRIVSLRGSTDDQAGAVGGMQSRIDGRQHPEQYGRCVW